MKSSNEIGNCDQTGPLTHSDLEFSSGLPIQIFKGNIIHLDSPSNST